MGALLAHFLARLAAALVDGWRRDRALREAGRADGERRDRAAAVRRRERALAAARRARTDPDILRDDGFRRD